MKLFLVVYTGDYNIPMTTAIFINKEKAEEFFSGLEPDFYDIEE